MFFMIKIIKNNHGPIFPPALVFAGYFFLAFGIISLYNNWILGAILILFSIFISFSFSGIEIDINEKKYREYSIYFGIRSGKWLQLDRFPCLTVLCNNETYEVHSRANITTSVSEKYFDVYMLDKLHREKLLIKRFKDPGSALEYAKTFSCSLNLELAKYNPILTAKTRLRRSRK